MKIISLIIVSLITSIMCMATNYYISPTGNDITGTGTISSPWQTINKVNTVWTAGTFAPGDSILFQRGGTYTGTLVPAEDGSRTLPIIVGAYGSGAKPIITGVFQPTSVQWTSLGGNIYETTVAVSTQDRMRMVTINGVQFPMGRYPNATAANKGFLTVDSDHDANQDTLITCDEIPSAVANWTGAQIVYRTQKYWSDTATIISHSGNVIKVVDERIATIRKNWGFFIQNDARTLDQHGEWFYNRTTGKLRMYLQSPPASYTIKVAATSTLVTLSSDDFITFDNIQFEYAHGDAMFFSTGGNASKNIKIQNCDFFFIGDDALDARNLNDTITVENCKMFDIGDYGIDFRGNTEAADDGPYAIIRNNEIRRVGIFPGMGGFANGASVANRYGINVSAPDCLVERNTIDSIGYIGIRFYGSRTVVQHNRVGHYCLVYHDGGGIYTWNARYPGTAGSILPTGMKMLYNVIHDGVGLNEGTNDSEDKVYAIYFDANAGFLECAYNTIYNSPGAGLYAQDFNTINMHHNTFYNTIQGEKGYEPQVILLKNLLHEQQNVGNTFKHNILVAKASTQEIIQFDGDATQTNHINDWGTIDSNYYIKPIGDTSNIIPVRNDASTRILYSLSGWVAAYAHDDHTKRSPLFFPSTTTPDNVIKFYVNTKFTGDSTFTLPAGYWRSVGGSDYGTDYTGTITLAPSTSKILVQAPAPATGKRYVSATASGSADGLTTATPWTLAQLNANWASISPGDSILFKRGDTIVGEIVVTRNGTATSRIVLGAYGTGAKPVISGFYTVPSANWTTHSTNVYKVNLSIPNQQATMDLLTINGVQYAKGRYPKLGSTNNGWLTTTSGTATSLTSTANTAGTTEVPGSGNWVGAHVVMRVNAWQSERRKVLTHSGDVITFSSTTAPDAGYGFFFQDDIRCVTQQGDWYYDTSANMLYVYLATAPSNYTVRVPVHDRLVQLDADSYITVRDLQIMGANEHGVYAVNGQTGNTIESCDVSFCGYTGVYFSGGTNHSFTVNNCTIKHCNDMGVNARGSGDNKIITNNIIDSIGVWAGMGGTGSIHFNGISTNGGNGTTISHNTLKNIGYSAMKVNGTNLLVEYNTIDTYCFVFDDGAGINGGDSEMSHQTADKTIRFNQVINGIGAPLGAGGTSRANGIYLDDGTMGYTVFKNYVANVSKYGIYIHNSRSHTITENFVYNAPDGLMTLTNDNDGPDNDDGVQAGDDVWKMNNLVVRHNVLVGKTSTQQIKFWTWYTSLDSFVTSDRNIDSNYYVKPIHAATSVNDSLVYGIRFAFNTLGTEVRSRYNITTWRAANGWDAATKTTPVIYGATNNPDTVFLFLRNTNKTTDSSVTISGNWKDPKGNLIQSGSTYVVPKFSMTVLIKNNATTNKTIYVSQAGNDGNDGLSTTTPIKTIARVNAIQGTLVPGDQVLFRRGDTWSNEVLTPAKSGKESQLITYGAYGTGAKPKISGEVQITAWTLVPGTTNIWESTSAITSSTTYRPNVVTINGQVQRVGREPDYGEKGDYTDYTDYDGRIIIPFRGYKKIVWHDSLANWVQVLGMDTAVQNWAGAKANLRINDYIIDTAIITSHTYTSAGSDSSKFTLSRRTVYEPQNQFGFFVSHHPKTLDKHGEWYYDPTTRKMRVYLTNNPSTYTIKFANQGTLLSLSNDQYLKFNNITFEGANTLMVRMENIGGDTSIFTKHLYFDSVEMFNAGQKFVVAEGSNTSKTNNIHFYKVHGRESLNYGFDLRTISYTSFINCTVKRIALIEGANATQGAQSSAPMVVNAGTKNHTFIANRVDSSGYSGIQFGGDNVLVENNVISNYGLTLDDGGGIYGGYQTDSSSNRVNRIVRKNVVYNAIGMREGKNSSPFVNGIYFDDNAHQIIADSNVVFNISRNGLLLHNAHHITLRNNIVYNARQGIFYQKGPIAGHTMVSNVVKHNVIIGRVRINSSSETSHYIANYDIGDGSTVRISQGGSIDSNYYLRPVTDPNISTISPTSGHIFRIRESAYGITGTNQTLAQWRTMHGHDLNSFAQPPANFVQSKYTGKNLDTLSLWLYNEDSVAKNYTLTQEYVDAYGNLHSAGTLILKPYSGIFLLETGNVVTNNKPNANAGNDINVQLPYPFVFKDTLNPTADAYTRQNTTTTNYGINDSLLAKTTSSGSFTRRSYLKFDLNSVEGVDSAKLRLFGSKVAPHGFVSIKITFYGLSNDTWTETGLTWGSQPTTTGGTRLGVLDMDSTIGYREMNVSSFISSQFSGDKTATIVFLDTTPSTQGDLVVFNSREKSTNKPQLIIYSSGTVSLNASASTDADGTITSYLWEKLSGPSGGTLTSADSVVTAINSLVEGTYVYKLTTTDNAGLTDTDTINVVVSPDGTPPPTPNVAPVANAGVDITQTTASTSATLVGSGTDTDGTIASYLWTKVSGAECNILTPASSSTVVQPLGLGTYVFRLTVTDDDGAFHSDDVTIIVKSSSTKVLRGNGKPLKSGTSVQTN
jgi:hypothetical protein